jgi:hypothetical protein
MSLFERAVRAHYPKVVDTPITIGNRYNFVLDHPSVREAIGVIRGDTLTKKDLLSIWSNDKDYPFKTKFLLTLFWGHIRPNNLHLILTDEHLEDHLSGLERALHGFESYDDKTIEQHHPYDDIQELYSKLECGCLRIKGLQTAFFTKIFFFFFATHRTFFSENGIQIIIADEWMRKAVYAELAEKSPEMLDVVFRPKTKHPCRFKSKKRTTSHAYFHFLKVFEMSKNELQKDYPELDSFALESYIFGSQELINRSYSQSIHH